MRAQQLQLWFGQRAEAWASTAASKDAGAGVQVKEVPDKDAEVREVQRDAVGEG